MDKISKQNIFIGIVGMGHVGLMLTMEILSFNKDRNVIVHGFDVDKDRLNCINNREFKKSDLENIASSIMKCNTWESRKENAILSGYGKIQTVNIDRKRRNNHHALREEIPG
jgi:UDP-N-acetyl-D-mannosaminuronate dehydrogenase